MLINVHSFYSLRYGTIALTELVDLLQEQGHEIAVLTDINNTTGMLDFIKDCQQKQFTGLAGVEFRNGNKVLYIGIARNNLGFREMNELLSDCNLNQQPLPEIAPDWSHTYVVYPFGKNIDLLRENEFIGVKPKQLTKLYLLPRTHLDRMVMWWPVTMSDKKDFRLHCQLRAIAHNIVLDKLTQAQAAERSDVLPSPAELVAAYSPFPQLVVNTANLLAQCRFEFDFAKPKHKENYTGSRYEDIVLLEKLALAGCKDRYGAGNQQALQRVREELAIIDKMHFATYFLVAWDTIRYSMSRGYYHVGRGSGANSIVAYCLRITDVCPIELDLYFERFLNPGRATPPDFDIDYSWKDRDDVFDYLFSRYGKRHTALLGMITTFKDRSIIREIAKVYGLPKAEIDALVAGRVVTRATGKVNDEISRKVMAIYKSLPKDFPNGRSIHAGGILITEEPITTYVALDLPPKGLATTQIDMYTAEDAGIHKLDILSQRGIGHIKEAVEIIKENQGAVVDVHNVALIKEDELVKANLRKANSIGCFYIESPAMQGVLTKLRCDTYITLVAASSIIRPGVGKSGMMRQYIERFHDPGKIIYLHPVLEEQLKETYGVMIYQEDVLKVGHHFGGLTKEEADILRRLMSGKTRGAEKHLAAIHNHFFDNTAAKGIPLATVQEVWRQLASFAGYSFSKAHSASFAVESMQSLYLKSYYPLEFMVAVINNEGGFYSRWFYIEMARRDGGIIHLPCVNNSGYKTVIYGKDIYLGLNTISGIETSVAEKIPQERALNGPYKSLEDFISRTATPFKQLLDLVRLDCLRFTGLDKKALRWQTYVLFKSPALQDDTPTLFQEPQAEIPLPSFQVHQDEHFYDELELLGFSVSRSAFDLVEDSSPVPIVAARDLLQNVGRIVTVVGLYVTAKPVMTVKKEAMAFGCFLDKERNLIHTVHFPQSITAQPLRGGGIYRISGKVTEEFGFATITVYHLEKLGIRGNPKYIEQAYSVLQPEDSRESEAIYTIAIPA